MHHLDQVIQVSDGSKIKKTSEAFILNKIKITYCKGFKIIIMNELEKSMNERRCTRTFKENIKNKI